MAKRAAGDSEKPPLWRSLVFKRLALLLGFFVLTGVVLVVDEPSGSARLMVGRPSPETVKAPVSVSVIDSDQTAKLRKEAAAGVGRVYRHVPEVESEAIDRAAAYFDSFGDQATAPESFDRLQELKERWARVDGEIVERSLALSPAARESTKGRTLDIMTALFRERVTEDNPDEVRAAVARLGVGLRVDEKPVVEEVVSTFVRPNYLFDRGETEARREEAAAAVEPVRLTKVKGETIVREGDVVSRAQALLLERVGLLRDTFDPNRVAGLLLLTAAVFGVFAAYVWRFQRGIFDDPRLILLVGLMVILSVVSAKILNVFPSVYLTPVIAVAMMTTILFGGQLGMATVLTSAFISSAVVDEKLVFLSMAVLGGVFAAFLSNNIDKRENLVRAGLFISLASAYAVFSASLANGVALPVAAADAGWGIVGGLFSTVLAIGTLPFLESTFNITTDLKLLELANPNQPLLTQLMTKAPGSYTHSIYAGTIAEAGARAIGANPILARVGAYYHDIGKSKRAVFFSENQVGVDNPHDRTSPHLSYLIIAAHVKDGVEMATKANLPREIIDIIREHHGTSVVAYFFDRAQRSQRDKERVSDVDFRYSGGRPRSREAALVMLADSVEAMARSLSKPSPARLEHLVRKAIQKRLTDDQLSLSRLTFADLELVGEAFSRALSSIYHTRVTYPDSSGVKVEPAKERRNAGKVVPFERKRYEGRDSNR